MHRARCVNAKVLVLVALAACAAPQGPRVAQYASVNETLRQARAAGADVGLAQDELDTARRLAAEGEYSRATAVLARAQADAELAMQVAREHERKRAAATEADASPALEHDRGAKERLAPLAEVEEALSATVITIPESILFRLGTAELLPTSAGTLDRLADAVLAASGADVTIRAFDASSRLAERRAASVRGALAARGVAHASVEGFGGDVERRVEITLRGAPPP